jgi:hypothetical protein
MVFELELDAVAVAAEVTVRTGVVVVVAGCVLAAVLGAAFWVLPPLEAFGAAGLVVVDDAGAWETGDVAVGAGGVVLAGGVVALAGGVVVAGAVLVGVPAGG